MKVESLIFDMDGTLWDSAANVAASWNEVLERQADVDMKVTEADIKSVMGMPMDAIAYKLFGAYSEDRMTQLMDACGDYENEYLREHGGVLYDGVEDTEAFGLTQAVYSQQLPEWIYRGISWLLRVWKVF